MSSDMFASARERNRQAADSLAKVAADKRAAATQDPGANDRRYAEKAANARRGIWPTPDETQN